MEVNEEEEEKEDMKKQKERLLKKKKKRSLKKKKKRGAASPHKRLRLPKNNFYFHGNRNRATFQKQAPGTERAESLAREQLTGAINGPTGV